MPMPGRNFGRSGSIDEGDRYDNGTSSGVHVPLKRQHTASISVENTALTEIITIYEKLKSRASENVFRVSKFRPMTSIDIELKHIVEETLPIKPSFTFQNSFDPKLISSEDGDDGGGGHNLNGNDGIVGCSILDFNKFQGLEMRKYLYFSADAGVLQSDKLEGLSSNYVQLLSSKNYWLNIIDPSELDLAILFACFNIHDLTISDIREGNTAEKIEIFKHYTFISMRLLSESSYVYSDPTKDPTPPSEDVDFNILIFKDFVITMHDKQWASIKDILGFLNLLASQANTLLTPDWVLFSIFIELAQDAQCMLDTIEPEINKIRGASKEPSDMSDIMRRNFDMEFQIYKISRFLKPKMNILRMLKNKCGKRLNKAVVCLLSDIFDDFREISHDLQHFNHILERSQDTYLALSNVEESRQANEMGKTMKRISEIALIFLPIQAVSGYFGMNVTVPFQTNAGLDPWPFCLLVVGSISASLLIFFCRKMYLRYEQSKVSKARRPVFHGSYGGFA